MKNNEVFECLLYGIKPGEKYPESVRKFALALLFHSPAGYDIVRCQFDYHLPHRKTVSAWMRESDINGKPGLQTDTLERLKTFVHELNNNGESLACALILDEMYIRKQVYWDQTMYQYVGYPTYPANASDFKEFGEKNENTDNVSTEDSDTKNKSLLATRALVFLLSGINKKFHFPVAYHFVKGLNAEELSDLTRDIIIKISEQGVNICNLTFDGAGVNLNMCTKLGANLDALSSDFKPYFTNPYDKKSVIYLIADPSHMEKLMRNLLANHGTLYDETDKEIKWSYFTDLQEISTDGNLLTHKMTKKHTKEYARNKMNVRLAVETLSASVARSMELLRHSNHPQFLEAEPTEQFTVIMDKSFDILNSIDPRHSNLYKRALNENNESEVFAFIERAKHYFKNLRMKQEKKKGGHSSKVYVLKTANKTPVLGFLINFHNLPRMYDDYVKNNAAGIKCLRTYAFSQDHLELFFCKIRSKNGHNDNPNVIQFQGAYRKLLSNVEIKPPVSANCMVIDNVDTDFDAFNACDLPYSNVFSISSKRARIDILSDTTFQNNLQKFRKIENKDELEIISDLQAMELTAPVVDGFVDISVAYAAKIIEDKFESRYCQSECCSNIFKMNEKLNDFKVSIISPKLPCASTYYICKIANSYFSKYRPNKTNQNRIDYRVPYYEIFEDIDFNKIYTKTDFTNHEVHRFHLVKYVVKSFLTMKTRQISKEITYNEYEKIIRSKLTKWVHFKGQ